MGATLLISELAARSGYSPSTLRYYEQVGLLTAADRSSGGYRLYDQAALARLRFIDRAKQLGLPLEEIRDLVTVWDGGLCAQVQDRLRAHITAKAADVQARIRDLTTFAAELEHAHTELATKSPDGACGDGCGCSVPEPATHTAQLLELTPTRSARNARRNPETPFTLPELASAQVPVACTLAVGDQLGRLAAWTELLDQVQAREVIDGGLRLRFPPDPALAGRLAELAAQEQACCSFLAFTLRPAGDTVTLDVTAPDDAAGVLADLFGRPA
jgi:DNA-binding transcriptional MerR regulator